ncbi:ECF RNA polymerase sigma factor SigW [Stieleria neptunia]|uniref:ECF RNA polymerase sigma factor SigW n=1 Tax=Stieleria neptunia TaxID=2527979 RepID=A0A518I3X3_9BACT|nr:sigma-70 family RNA polymerase sigma factor [Stieleria neptunia]QDV47756.1 ECF RNA polymerase sigma factor SigW [Stieleria neptunia]
MQSNFDLIQAVTGRNDQEAFAQIVVRYERLVWTVAWGELHDYHATQDVTQETFLIAHRRLRELRDPDAVGFWLSKIARREAQRTRKRTPITRPIEELNPVDDQSAKSVDLADKTLLDAVAKLPEHERVVTVLRFFDGHSVAEIAEITGRPVGTVTKQLSRAINRLKRSLQAETPVTKISLHPSRSYHAH